jgi:hypothetical protein
MAETSTAPPLLVFLSLASSLRILSALALSLVLDMMSLSRVVRRRLVPDGLGLVWR